VSVRTHIGELEDGNGPALLHHKFFCIELCDGDAESLLALTPYMSSAVFLFLLCPYSVLQTPCRNVIGVLFNPNY
jgi:hypothetical protein